MRAVKILCVTVTMAASTIVGVVAVAPVSSGSAVAIKVCC
jgi:hypothetical protein